jgi:dTDP-4-dehydrorhamnose 3,5-epimerase
MSAQVAAHAALPALRLLSPPRHEDARGFLCELYRADVMRSHGIARVFVQENHSLSRAQGTVRGLHFQVGAAAQAKLVHCIRGAILDVAVDIRRGSPTFGRHAAVELSAQNGQALYVPEGFAHGYCTLVPDSEVLYKLTAYYHPPAERGLAFDDPALGIHWPVEPAAAVTSARDRAYPRLAELADLFSFADYPD